MNDPTLHDRLIGVNIDEGPDAPAAISWGAFVLMAALAFLAGMAFMLWIGGK